MGAKTVSTADLVPGDRLLIDGRLVRTVSYGWYHVPDCPTAHARVDMGPTGFGPITVRWDTPYGYVHEGEGCGELHARFVVELGERRPQWRERLRWCDEFSGDWFDMGTDPFAVLCSAGAA